ncbi:DNA polymerase III subunit beta [Candidatus Cyanaurora vandensis]|uniref:DNA polymerase III subunit beta n=1 Tax=Candidatus Cyanaurora vandensis TaxID=2714958 RepID=UPI00257C260E|nr:DNA polymerase III subunit beta [Candidatus Cyanaurora vandensis]
MKVLCPQHLFNQHLALVSRAVASARPVQPILANIKLEGSPDQGGVLRLTGYDLELGIVSQLPAQVIEPGAVTLPVRLLGDIVSRLPNLDITLRGLTGDGDELAAITLDCGAGSYQIRGMGAQDFPHLPELPEGESLYLSVEQFLTGIRKTLFAIATDESKHILTGVHLKGTGAGLEFATTDGHRLALMALPQSDELLGLDLTVPGRALQELERMLGLSPAELLEARYDRSQIIFTMPDQTLTSRLLEGQYPNYGQLLPKNFARQVTINRKEFISVLERIAVIASQKNNIVRLEITSDQIALCVDAPDVGSGREEIAVELVGDDLTCAFNVKYLMDPLKVMDCLEVQLNLNGAVQPAVLKPVDSTDFQYLIMPVQIRG